MSMDPKLNFAGFFVDTGGAPVEAEVMPGLFFGSSSEAAVNGSKTTQSPMIVFRYCKDPGQLG